MHFAGKTSKNNCVYEIYLSPFRKSAYTRMVVLILTVDYTNPFRFFRKFHHTHQILSSMAVESPFITVQRLVAIKQGEQTCKLASQQIENGIEGEWNDHTLALSLYVCERVYVVLEGLEINQKHFVLGVKICVGFSMC